MFILQILKQAATITIFVLIMMLVIEYITIKLKSNKSRKFSKSPWIQIIAAALLGVMPGCLGSFAIVSMYIHRTVGLAALVTNLIATSGDETFFMIAIIPETVVKLTVIIFIISVIAGIIVQLIFKDKKYIGRTMDYHYVHNNEPDCVCFDRKLILKQLRNILPLRLMLIIVGLALTGFLVFGGHLHEHQFSLIDTSYFQTEGNKIVQLNEGEATDININHEHDIDQDAEHNVNRWGWEKITFLLVAGIGLFIIITVPDHFLKKHLWDHIIKKHFLRLFLWTLFAFVVMHFLSELIDVKKWIEGNIFLIILIAGLIGLIPESGPHIIFISLFASGIVPFAVLLTNSIVQDGHGALPLLAESGKSFILVKTINFIIGIFVGYLFILI